MKRDVWMKGRTVQLSGDELVVLRRALALAIMEDTRTMKRAAPKTDPHRRSNLAMQLVEETDLYGKISAEADAIMIDAEVTK